MSKYAIALCLTLVTGSFLPVLTGAQNGGAPQTSKKGNIKGAVLRKSDQTPLYNVAVRIENSESSTRTDKKGEYNFTAVDADKDYVLVMTKAPLYDDGQTTVNVKADLDNKAEDVALARVNINTNTAREFQYLAARQNFDKLETRVDFLDERCEGEKDDFCKSIRDIKKTLEKRNPLDIQASIGVLDK